MYGNAAIEISILRAVELKICSLTFGPPYMWNTDSSDNELIQKMAVVAVGVQM